MLSVFPLPSSMACVLLACYNPGLGTEIEEDNFYQTSFILELSYQFLPYAPIIIHFVYCFSFNQLTLFYFALPKDANT